MQENKQEKSPIKQRILQYLGKKGISMYDCYAKTGITRGILGQNNGISEDNLAKFLAYFTDVNIEWLVTGQGGMFCNDDAFKENKQDCIQNNISVQHADESIILKMYKEKDAKVEELLKENGRLEERIKHLESRLIDSENKTEESEVLEAFTNKSSGDYGESSLPTKQSTISKRLSAGKI